LQQAIPESLGRVQERIQKAARRSGRRVEDITLVAVTKTIALEKVLPFVQAGVRHLGENRVQEALLKYQKSDGSRLVVSEMHLLGPLQTNKAKKAAAFFDVIQSLDREELAVSLDRHAGELDKRLACLVEVKISPETTKSGVPPERLDEFFDALKERSHLEIKGLMGIPPPAHSPETARPYFARLRELFEKFKLQILSMGMSSDFEVAIEEGSTMVRIGTALFGERP
jgi:PLP dependent protein